MTINKLMIIPAIALLLPLAACNDDDECVQCPDTGTPEPTMANVWPHADGTAWTFDVVYRELDTIKGFQAADSAPLSMEDLHEELQGPMPGVVVEEAEGLYRLALDGEITTQSEVTAQMVAETFFEGVPVGPGKSGPRVDPLLALIAQGRPDLRPAIAARYGLTEKSFESIAASPYFLGGYAYAYEDSGYFGYGDLHQNHSWVYLEGDLSVGSEFSLQLVPGLAQDIWLSGRIWGVGDLTVNGREFENVLECMYILDMGEQMVTNESGDILGTFHSYMYGNSFFVPELGPVAGVERRVFGPSDLVVEEPRGNRLEIILDLVGVTYGE